MAAELPNNALNNHVSMMGNPHSIHFASLYTQLQDSLQERQTRAQAK